MKRHLGSIFALALGVVSARADAYTELTGDAGNAGCPADAGCWVTMYGVMYNICGDYRLLRIPLANRPNTSPPGPPPSVPWSAKFYGSTNTICSITIVPDDGTAIPASNSCGYPIPANGSAGAVVSAWSWSTGPSSPMTVSTWSTPFTAAYALCWVPANGWLATVTWW